MPADKLKLAAHSAAVPALLLLGAELLLRAAGFEFHPPSFLPPPPPCLVLGGCSSGGLTLFERKGRDFVLRREYCGWFNDQSFPAVKPADEFRVFILGGSSIYNLYGQMESVYREAGRKVRVVNLGGNSFGTGRLMPVFGEALGYDPDLVIVYSGHNEFVDIALVKYSVRTTPLQDRVRGLLGRSRLYNFTEMLVYKTGMAVMKLRKKRDNGVVRYFSVRLGPGTDKDRIYGLYRGYLAGMAAQARARGVPLVLATVGYNRTIPPVNPAAARDLHGKGMALLREGKYKEALAALDRAQDLEQTPYGANETSNAIVRETAARYKVPLLDIDAAILASSPNGIPGGETFMDQCHFNDSRFLAGLFRREIGSAITGKK